MRFKATKDNLRVQLASNEVAACVRKAASFLVPRFTTTLYLLAVPATLFQGSEPGVSVLTTGKEPSNFLQSFRLLIRPGELVVVSSREHPFSREQWRDLADQLAT